MLQGYAPWLWSHRESNSDLIFRRDLFYPLNYETPLHAIVYAKILPTSAKRTCSDLPSAAISYAKMLPTSAKEPVLICRVQLYLMQRYNNLERNRYFSAYKFEYFG